MHDLCWLYLILTLLYTLIHVLFLDGWFRSNMEPHGQAGDHDLGMTSMYLEQ